MDPSFIPVEVVPSKTPFGLDQLLRSYKSALGAAAAIAAAPAIGDADESFGTMFLVSATTPESAESATRVDLLYQGYFSALPDQKHDASTAVQTASSSAADDGRRASPPLTVQFYAPITKLSYISAGEPGTDVVADPVGDPQIITVTVADQAISIGSGTIQDLVDHFFVVQTLETHASTEIVPGQYWQNESQKIKAYTAFIWNLAPGPYVILHNPGINYAAADSLTIAGGGGTADITVTAVGVSDSITAFTVGTNTITHQALNLAASGGAGTGATFDVIIVT